MKIATPTQTPEQESPKVPEAQPPVSVTPEPDTPFSKLLAFYTAATGRKIVTSRKLRNLTEATKGMRTKSGKIKMAILETLSDEQRATLDPLVKEFLSQRK
jgi:hypothetical protein